MTQRTKRPARYQLTEVLLDEHNGASALLEPVRRAREHARPKALAVPLGAVDATMLSLVLHGLPAGERPSWHGLYTTTLATAGVTVERVELDAVAAAQASRLIGAIVISTPATGQGRPATRVAAPVEAALLVALETRAPLYVTAPAQARLARAPSDDRSDGEPAGAALLATLLASLPDEDFGPIH